MKHPPNRSVEQMLQIKAPPEAVWKALTDAQHLVNWFPLKATVTRPGPDGTGGSIWTWWADTMQWTEKIELWDEPRRLRTKWGGDEPNAMVTFVDFHLQGQGGGTILRVVHSGFGSGGDWDMMYDGVSRGWAFELRGLKFYLEEHFGESRRVAWARLPIDGDPEMAWRDLLGERGLHLRANAVAFGPGARITLQAAGQALTGEALVSMPRQLVIRLDSHNRALMRIEFDDCSGSGIEARLWATTYGLPDREVLELESRFREVLDSSLSKTHASAR